MSDREELKAVHERENEDRLVAAARALQTPDGQCLLTVIERHLEVWFKKMTSEKKDDSTLAREFNAGACHALDSLLGSIHQVDHLGPYLARRHAEDARRALERSQAEQEKSEAKDFEQDYDPDREAF